jgi:hypothetical protein
VRIAFHIREMVMLPVHGGPFPRNHTRKEQQVQVHEVRNNRVQGERSMRDITMQVDRGTERRYLQDSERDQSNPQTSH